MTTDRLESDRVMRGAMTVRFATRGEPTLVVEVPLKELMFEDRIKLMAELLNGTGMWGALAPTGQELGIAIKRWNAHRDRMRRKA